MNNDHPLDSDLSDRELEQVFLQGAMQPSVEEQARFWQDLQSRLDGAESLSGTEVQAPDAVPLRSLPPLVDAETLGSARARKRVSWRPAFVSMAAAVVLVLIALPLMQETRQSPERLEKEASSVESQESQAMEPMTLGAAPPAEESTAATNAARIAESQPASPRAVIKEELKQNQAETLAAKQRKPAGHVAPGSPVLKKEVDQSELSPLKAPTAEQAELAKAVQARKQVQAAEAEQRWADLKKILADLPVTVKPLNASQAELHTAQAQAKALESRLSAWSVPSALTYKFFRADQVTYLLEISAQP